jgi:osmotically-inducible protein OsmY
MQIGRMPSVTLISSFLALAAGAFALDLRSSELSQPAIHRPTNEPDAFIARALRDRISAATDLSITARSIKLYSSNGVVKLRGKVIYAHERDRIVAHARSIPGVRAVDDQLSIVIP